MQSGTARTVGLGVKLPIANGEEFIEKFGASLTRGGIFLRAKKVVPPGTRVQLDLKLADGQPLLRSSGRVEFVTGQDGRGTPGMGIRFLEMTPEARQFLEEALARLPAANSDEPPVPPGVGPVSYGDDSKVLPLKAESVLLTSTPREETGEVVTSASAAASGAADSGADRPVASAATSDVPVAVTSTAAPDAGTESGAPVIATSTAALNAAPQSGVPTSMSSPDAGAESDVPAAATSSASPEPAVTANDTAPAAAPAASRARPVLSAERAPDLSAIGTELRSLRRQVRASWALAAALAIAAFLAGRHSITPPVQPAPAPVVVAPAPKLTPEEEHALDFEPAVEDEPLTAEEQAQAAEVIDSTPQTSPVDDNVVVPTKKAPTPQKKQTSRKTNSSARGTLVASAPHNADTQTVNGATKNVAKPSAEELAERKQLEGWLAAGRGSSCKGRMDAITRVMARTRVSAHREMAMVLRARCFSDTWRVEEAKSEFGRYLAQFPKGKFADEARRVLATGSH